MMNEKEKKELKEYTKGVRDKNWQPMSVPKAKMHQIKLILDTIK